MHASYLFHVIFLIAFLHALIIRTGRADSIGNDLQLSHLRETYSDCKSKGGVLICLIKMAKSTKKIKDTLNKFSVCTYVRIIVRPDHNSKLIIDFRHKSDILLTKIYLKPTNFTGVFYENSRRCESNKTTGCSNEWRS